MAENSDPRILSFLAMRRTVGAVAIALPTALALWGYGFSGGILPTMSDFYYTSMHDIFVGCLLVIGVFLLAYQGYEKAADEWISDITLLRIAGVSVMMVALLPTDQIGTESSRRGTVHLVAAGVFLASIGTISWAKFSRTGSARLRVVYKVLGAVTLAALALMVLGKLISVRDIWPEIPTTWIFWLETIAVLAYGAAWLIKGKAMEGMASLGQRLLGRGA